MSMTTLKKLKFEAGTPIEEQALKLGYSPSDIELATGLSQDSIPIPSDLEKPFHMNSATDKKVMGILPPGDKTRELELGSTPKPKKGENTSSTEQVKTIPVKSVLSSEPKAKSHTQTITGQRGPGNGEKIAKAFLWGLQKLFIPGWLKPDKKIDVAIAVGTLHAALVAGAACIIAAPLSAYVGVGLFGWCFLNSLLWATRQNNHKAGVNTQRLPGWQ